MRTLVALLLIAQVPVAPIEPASDHDMMPQLAAAAAPLIVANPSMMLELASQQPTTDPDSCSVLWLKPQPGPNETAPASYIVMSSRTINGLTLCSISQVDSTTRASTLLVGNLSPADALTWLKANGKIPSS